jgi:hypothetical protein
LWLRSLLIALARRDTNGSSRSYTSCQKLWCWHWKASSQGCLHR